MELPSHPEPKAQVIQLSERLHLLEVKNPSPQSVWVNVRINGVSGCAHPESSLMSYLAPGHSLSVPVQALDISSDHPEPFVWDYQLVWDHDS